MKKDRDFSAITSDILKYSKICSDNSKIDPSLYDKYDVKRGLRDKNGRGVLTGLTEISEVYSGEFIENRREYVDGQLFFRGYNVEDLVKGFVKKGTPTGFEETTYLLLFGNLPNETELNDFKNLVADYRSLPSNFVRDIILKAPSRDMMNALSRSVLMLYTYDNKADDISIPNVLRQCIQLIAMFPLISVYSYQATRYYHEGESLYIHAPKKDLSTAENILHLLRPDSKYTELEARILDIALVIHAEHGGGNNSTFTTHVVTSSGTDTYSTIAASLGSLKGPKHGGANIKVVHMFEDMKKNISDWSDEKEISNYLKALLDGKAFDNAGLIYGMGHAIYTKSDPRANILKGFVEKLSIAKGKTKEFELYSNVEKLAPKIISERREMFKGVSANVDFYSGFVYSMLELPTELFTPMFAMSRISGWSAHRLEELINSSKIIRPAYENVSPRKPYTPIDER
ncbi:MAG: citrate/2-methylcitrate synthase [Lachnospiraceae bacterium]|nr:citrate/2-methylcitrate synthase [Lachnospiraceae bacterium]